jgi:hypothetical protein
MKPLSIARLATFVGISNSLRTLSLRSCAIDDESFILICERIPFTKHLSKIDITDNFITDYSVENGLASLIECVLAPPLKEIIFT